MKNLLNSKSKKTVFFLLCFIVVICVGFTAFSHLYFHRSVMASLAEMYMIIIDRDKLYSEGEAYEANVKLRSVANLEPYEKPDNVSISVEYESVNEHGMQVLYFNKDAAENTDTLIIYIPGGAYLNNPLKYHWSIIETLATETQLQVILPLYLKVPNYTCEEAYKAMLEFYKDVATRDGVKHIVFAGDSSGGGMSLVLAQLLRDNCPDLLQPQELFLIAPWLDVSMDNEEISEYEPVDPMLDIYGLIDIGKMWAGKRDVHDPLASPIYGTFENLGNITIFIGTRDILCPDCLKFSKLLNDEGIKHTLVVKEGLNHPYPLFPTSEAHEAQQLMIDTINGIKN